MSIATNQEKSIRKVCFEIIIYLTCLFKLQMLHAFQYANNSIIVRGVNLSRLSRAELTKPKLK